MKPVWIRAAEFSGIQLAADQLELMERYHSWLATEGVRAGGIGPAEVERIDRRHLGDSLLFASQMTQKTGTVWDLGSGVGLPGIPLAICLPDLEFVLVDRSGRRTDLLRRVIRILDLENCQVVRREIAEMTGEPDMIVSRASLSPDRLVPVAREHLRDGGVAVVGGSWQERPDHPEWSAIEIPPDVLDHVIWLLIMRPE